MGIVLLLHYSRVSNFLVSQAPKNNRIIEFSPEGTVISVSLIPHCTNPAALQSISNYRDFTAPFGILFQLLTTFMVKTFLPCIQLQSAVFAKTYWLLLIQPLDLWEEHSSVLHTLPSVAEDQISPQPSFL